MQTQPKITVRDNGHSDAVEARVREEIAKLEQFFDRIMTCSVVIESPHRRRHKGKQYRLRIHITVPGNALTVNRDPSAMGAHEAPPHGTVTQLFPRDDFGIIETPGGEEVYFHRNAVPGGEYDALEIGTRVRYADSQGDKGPQASSVTPVGKRHPGSSAC